MKTLIKFWAPLLILFLLSPKTINSQVEKIISNIIYIYAFNVWIEDNNSMDKTMASIGNAFDNINKVKSFIKKG